VWNWLNTSRVSFGAGLSWQGNATTGANENLVDLLNILNKRSRHPGRKLDKRASRKAPSLSAAEYWTYLCAAALLVVATVGRPRPLANKLLQQPASGAFGISRSADEPQVVQYARAQKPGRGRHANAPWPARVRFGLNASNSYAAFANPSCAPS